MDPRRPGPGPDPGDATPDPRAGRGRPGDARLDDAAPVPPGAADPRTGGNAAPDRPGGMEGEGGAATPGERGAEP